MNRNNNRGGGNSGRGHGSWNRNWRHRGRCNWRGRGQNKSADLSSEDEIIELPTEYDGDSLSSAPTTVPPPPKKRKRSNIKEEIISAWKLKLPGYSLYYPDTPPQLPEIDNKIALILEYANRNGHLNHGKLTSIEKKEYFEVIVERIINDEIFLRGWPEFAMDLDEDPSEVVNLWGCVMHKMVTESIKSNLEAGLGKETLGVNSQGEFRKIHHIVGKIHAGLMKQNPVIPLVRINSSLVGKFVTVRGGIVGTGTIRAVCLQMTFYCSRCETEFVFNLRHGIYAIPTQCGVSKDCDFKGPFETRESSHTTLMMDSRKFKLQDIQNTNASSGEVPKTIECEVTNGLVQECNTGDVITLTGIVKMNKESRLNGEQSLHNLFIEVVAIRSHKESERTMGGNWFSFSNKDYCAIRAIHDVPNLFRLFVASFCPSIFGHELVKAALILSLFGGTSSPNKNATLSRRSDINILMIGDPGIGKSQMLHVVTEVAPRGVFVCGSGSSVAGLTVTLVKDGDEYSMEAGALVMADRGVCCIDEFDKMKDQHYALLEAMEQQSVSIAKSGVFRTLPARATVIAAANPVGGHYDQRKSVVENIKTSTAILSRFDITFILLDKPDDKFDQKLVEHVMGVGRIETRSTSDTGSKDSTLPEECLFQPPLLDRLKLKKEEVLDLIPHSLIRKYVAYARQYVNPKISQEAGAILKEYYLKLRAKHRMLNCMPITTRQLESLVRLTEARAKIELREFATAEDAKDILEIFESSLSSVFDDEVVGVSALSESILIGASTGQGKSISRTTQAKTLVRALQQTAEQQNKNIFTINEIKHSIRQLGLQAAPDALIATLNNEGYLLKKGGNVYQLQITNF